MYHNYLQTKWSGWCTKHVVSYHQSSNLQLPLRVPAECRDIVWILLVHDLAAYIYGIKMFNHLRYFVQKYCLLV
jgi:hypothetical protein